MSASLLAELIPYFAWEERDQLVSSLQATLVETHCSRFERMIRALTALDERRCEQIIERLSRLPESSFVRLFMAPETGSRMGYDGAALADRTAGYLESALLAEEVRDGVIESAPQAAWSALGDYYAPGPNDPDRDLGSPTSFDPRRKYVAPSIDGIVVDFASPSATEKLPQIAGDAARISEDARLTSLERIRRAIDLIDRGSRGAYQMLKAFTSVIVVHYDPSTPGFYTSASTTFSLKRPVLRNPFVPGATISEIADGLVHETIHCVCDLVEMREGRWLLGDETAQQLAAIKVASPWTQRPLDLHTYLQACWVWYGLWNFWIAVLDANAHEAEDAVRCAARAYRGFHDGAALERLSVARAHVRSDVFEALAGAQARVLEEVRALNLVPA